jgi:ATP-dependent Clp protease ATP-binding subunit ClpB
MVDSNMRIEMTDSAIDWIAQEGFDPQFGARPVKRTLQRYLLNPLAKKILSGELSSESIIVVDNFGEGLVIINKKDQTAE